MSCWNQLAKAALPQVRTIHPETNVLGTTTNGNKIFADRGADHTGYAHWNSADHNNAAKVHAARATQLMASSQRAGGSLTLRRQAMQHQHFAATHRQAAPATLAASSIYVANLMKSGPATTARGMPIHPPHEGVNQKIIAAAGHDGSNLRPSHAISARPHYSASDHLEAGEHHIQAASMATNPSDRNAHHILSQAHSMAAMALTKHPELHRQINSDSRLSPSA